MSTPAARAKKSKLKVLYPEYAKWHLNTVRLPKSIQPSKLAKEKYEKYVQLPSSIRMRLHLDRAASLYSSAAATLVKYSSVLLRDDLSPVILEAKEINQPVKAPGIYAAAYKLDKPELFEYVKLAVEKGYMPCSFMSRRLTKTLRGESVNAEFYMALSPFHVVSTETTEEGVQENNAIRMKIAGLKGFNPKNIPRAFGQLTSALKHMHLAIFYHTNEKVPSLKQEMDHLFYPREKQVFENDYIQHMWRDPEEELHSKTLIMPMNDSMKDKLLILQYLTWFDGIKICAGAEKDVFDLLVRKITLEVARNEYKFVNDTDKWIMITPSEITGKLQQYKSAEAESIKTSPNDPDKTIKEANKTIDAIQADPKRLNAALFQMRTYWNTLEKVEQIGAQVQLIHERKRSDKQYKRNVEKIRISQRNKIKTRCLETTEEEGQEKAEKKELRKLRETRGSELAFESRVPLPVTSSIEELQERYEGLNIEPSVGESATEGIGTNEEGPPPGIQVTQIEAGAQLTPVRQTPVPQTPLPQTPLPTNPTPLTPLTEEALEGALEESWFNTFGYGAT